MHILFEEDDLNLKLQILLVRIEPVDYTKALAQMEYCDSLING